MAGNPLPVGPVTIIEGTNIPDPSKVYGLAFCKVLPPTDLTIPL